MSTIEGKEEKTYAERVEEGHMFINQFIGRELTKLRELVKTKVTLIQTLGRMVHEELILNGIEILDGQLGIKPLGYALEIHYRKNPKSKVSQVIWRVTYGEGTINTFPKNDPKGLLKVIEPFMHDILNNSLSNVKQLMDNVVKESETVNEDIVV